ncbi:hypothetical protein BKA69DRAFT_1050148, partial [Paraphysoderma sedebokerense]
MSDSQNTFFSNSNMNNSGCAPVKSRSSWHIPSSPQACSRRNRRKSSTTSFDITASLAEMDTMYDACFSSWVRTESNLSTICAYLHRLSTEFDAAQVAKVVQFVSSDWKIESIAWLVRCVGGEDCFGNGKSGCKGCNESWAFLDSFEAIDCNPRSSHQFFNATSPIKMCQSSRKIFATSATEYSLFNHSTPGDREINKNLVIWSFERSDLD